MVLNIRRRGEGTTLTWFVATIVIFFSIVVFIFLALLISGQKAVRGGDQIFLEDSNVPLLEVQRDFYVFLNEQVDLGGEKISILGLIANNEIEKGEASGVFNSAAAKFLREKYPRLEGAIIMTWLSVYGKEEGLRGARTTDAFHAGGFNCVPNPEKSFVLEQEKGENRIVFCISKLYFEIREERRPDE